MIDKIEVFDTNLDVVYLKKKVLSNEKKIIKKYKPLDFYNKFTDGGTGLGHDSLTSRFAHFNVLKWWGTKKLKEEIKKNYYAYFDKEIPILYIQCWANVMRTGQQIKPHKHREKNDKKEFALSGNLTVFVDQESYTFYDSLPVLNKNGRMTLFPSDVVHWTSVYTGESNRVSIAFDIIDSDYWEKVVPNSCKSHFIRL